MFNRRFIVVIIFFCSIISLPAFSDEPNYAPGEVLVRFAPKEGGEYLRGVEKEALVTSICNCMIKDESEFLPGLTLVSIPEGLTVEEAVTKFKNTQDVLYAQPNYIYRYALTPNDPNFYQLWGLHNDGNTGGTVDADIDAPEAWDIHTDANNIIVAVIDTGVDYTHPDLAANMWTDANGYHGYDFCTCSDEDCTNSSKLRDSDPMDDHGHGTHCAGIIGADGNDSNGVTGVCWKAKIMAVKWMAPVVPYGTSGSTSVAVDSNGNALAWGVSYSKSSINCAKAVLGFTPQAVDQSINSAISTRLLATSQL